MDASVGLRRVHGAVRVGQELETGLPHGPIRLHKERDAVLPTAGSREGDLGIRAHLRKRGRTWTRATDCGLRMTGTARVSIEGRSQAVGNTLGIHKAGCRIVEESQLVRAKICDGATRSSGGSPRPGIDRAGPGPVPVVPVPVLPE